MKECNKIGFNNFKSFGEKVQTFSQKPLTLIYGPNSIGKSSLLHFMLYAEYIKYTGNVNLLKTDFAGDPIDLGGFANFIHQRSTDTKISYQLTFHKEADIGKYFAPQIYIEVKDFEKKGAFTNEIDVNDIKERIQAYRKKEKDSLIIFNSMRRWVKEVSDNTVFSQKQRNEVDERALQLFELINFPFSPLASGSEKEKISQSYQACLNSCDLLEEVLERDDGQQLDGLDKLILYIVDCEKLYSFASESNLDQTAKTVWDVYRFFSRINDIKKLKLEFEFGIDNKKGNYSYRYFLDNELIYTFSSKNNSLEINKSCQVLACFKESGFFRKWGNEANQYIITLRELYGVTSGILDPVGFDVHFSFPLRDCLHYSDIGLSIHLQVVIALKGKDNLKSSQYLSPIRFVPERYDLHEKDTEKVQRISTQAEGFDFFLPPWINVPLLKLKFLKALFYNTRMCFWVLLLKKRNKRIFFNIIKESPIVIDAWNEFKKNKKKISLNSSANSEKMWSLFIHSEGLQDSVNKWFSVISKLDIPYRIQTQKFEEKNSMFRKLFRLKPTTFRILSFVDTRNGTRVSPREMGLGFSQVLPILIATHSLENYNIFIEQPELHLHPAFQCELADEVIRSMKTKNNEFVIETHSEHLLLRLMKRMRETSEGILAKNDELALTPDDICLLYVDHNGKMTHLNELEIDEDGTLLDPWPHGFFEEGFKERFA